VWEFCKLIKKVDVVHSNTQNDVHTNKAN